MAASRAARAPTRFGSHPREALRRGRDAGILIDEHRARSVILHPDHHVSLVAVLIRDEVVERVDVVAEARIPEPVEICLRLVSNSGSGLVPLPPFLQGADHAYSIWQKPGGPLRTSISCTSAYSGPDPAPSRRLRAHGASAVRFEFQVRAELCLFAGGRLEQPPLAGDGVDEEVLRVDSLTDLLDGVDPLINADALDGRRQAISGSTPCALEEVGWTEPASAFRVWTCVRVSSGVDASGSGACDGRGLGTVVRAVDFIGRTRRRRALGASGRSRWCRPGPAGRLRRGGDRRARRCRPRRCVGRPRRRPMSIRPVVDVLGHCFVRLRHGIRPNPRRVVRSADLVSARRRLATASRVRRAGGSRRDRTRRRPRDPSARPTSLFGPVRGPGPPTTTRSFGCTGLREGSRPIPPTTVSVSCGSSGAGAWSPWGSPSARRSDALVVSSFGPAPLVRVAEGPSRPTPRMEYPRSPGPPGPSIIVRDHQRARRGAAARPAARPPLWVCRPTE